MFITPVSFSELKYNVTMLLVGHLELLLVFCQKNLDITAANIRKNCRKKKVIAVHKIVII